MAGISIVCSFEVWFARLEHVIIGAMCRISKANVHVILRCFIGVKMERATRSAKDEGTLAHKSKWEKRFNPFIVALINALIEIS